MSNVKCQKSKVQRGFTLVELLLVIGLTAVLAGIIVVGLSQSRSEKELESTRVKMVGLLREAQSRSVIQDANGGWGVHFENDAANPFFALFRGSYSSENVERYQELPQSIRYATSTLPEGAIAEVTFSQLDGAASGSSTVAIEIADRPSSSSTITISSGGAVSFTQ